MEGVRPQVPSAVLKAAFELDVGEVRRAMNGGCNGGMMGFSLLKERKKEPQNPQNRRVVDVVVCFFLFFLAVFSSLLSCLFVCFFLVCLEANDHKHEIPTP